MRAILLALSLLLAGCASESRLVKAAEESPLLEWKAIADDGVQLTLRGVIVRNGPGSWVRDADWDEYVLSIQNHGAGRVTVQSIRLSNELLADVSHTTERTALESETRKNIDQLHAAGELTTVGATLVGGPFAILASIGPWVSPIVPIAVLGAGLYATASYAQRSEDRQVTEYRLDRRGLHLPRRVLAASELRGSAFFPITPRATGLHVRYESAGMPRELRLDLGEPR